MCLKRSAFPSSLARNCAVECLRETGFVFLFAPLYHPAMKAWARCAARLASAPSSIWSARSPIPPTRARRSIGVLAPSRVLLVGRTLAALGAKRAFVVHGTDGIDELTTTGESVVARIEETEPGELPR